MRNKCAHQATYEPGDDDLSQLHGFNEEVSESLFDSDLIGAIEGIANALENRALEIGATDIEVIVPPPDPLVDRWLDR